MTATKPIRHGGRLYDLDALAERMEYESREAVHSSAVVPCGPQEFWNEFVRRFPDEAEHIVGMSDCLPES